MSAWINGRRGQRIDVRDRGLAYGDGLFETMRVRAGRIRLLDWHLERLLAGCQRLGIDPPAPTRLRRELVRHAARRDDAILKLIITRGVGTRGYRPSGAERATRVLCLYPPPPSPPSVARVRLCALRLGTTPVIAGIKTLNRLEQVLARSEWNDPRIYEGLLRDAAGHVICGTSSNFFVRRGSLLLTPRLDRCGIAGVMRRWVMSEAAALGLRVRERRLGLGDLARAEEMFVTNAIAGVVSVGSLETGDRRIAFTSRRSGRALRARLVRL